MAQEVKQLEKPNVLFILTDDQTYDTINALGNTEIITPNIDRLVKQGTSFTHAYNQGSWTPAICAASRRMISTGRNLYETGLGPEKTTPQERFPLWGETFRNNGYETFLTGKWHMTKESFVQSYDIGRAVYNGGMATEKSGGQWEPSLWNYDVGNPTGKNFEIYIKKKHTSEQIADAAADFIKNREYDEPYFAYVGFLAPHDPRQSPQSFIDMYPPHEISLPANFKQRHELDQGDYYVRDEQLLPFPRTKEDVQEFIAEYYAMITHMDENLGRILDAVEESGQAENTIIVFTADHGLAVGKHGLLGKQSQYDHSVRSPFIMAGKGVPVGKEMKGMFYLNSAFPTTAELAGIPIPETVQAPSIVPLLKGEKNQTFKNIVGSYRHFQRMITDGDFKLIYYPLTKDIQLFNLKDDPDELLNLASNDKYQHKLDKLMQDLRQEMKEIGDPMEFNNPKESYQDWVGYINCSWQLENCSESIEK